MLIQIDIDSAPMLDDQRTEIVDAMRVVGMGVGEEYGIERIHFGIEQLLAQIGRRIDQDSRDAGPTAALDQKRCPATAVLGIVGIAVAPTPRETRDTA